MSSRYNDRSKPRDYRDLDRERVYDNRRGKGEPNSNNRRSLSPSSRHDERFSEMKRYGNDDRNGRIYDQRNERERSNASSSRYGDRYNRRDDRYSHQNHYSKRREPSPPTRQARRDEEERREKERKQREDEKEALIISSKAKEREEGAVNEDEDQDEEDMMKAMGFGGFGTTKGKKVEGNQTGTAEVRKERTWRQYMQRKGGFNRPLSPVRK